MVVDTQIPETKLTREPERHSAFNAGDWVEVLSKEEILSTLDKDGRLEGMPFMPEMFACCGRRFRVSARAHKTCDTVNDYKGRKLKDAVHLEGVRCNGQFHGGCEAGCLIYWKLSWVRKVSDAATSGRGSFATGCTEADVMAGTQRPPGNGDTAVAY